MIQHIHYFEMTKAGNLYKTSIYCVYTKYCIKWHKNNKESEIDDYFGSFAFSPPLLLPINKKILN